MKKIFNFVVIALMCAASYDANAKALVNEKNCLVYASNGPTGDVFIRGVIHNATTDCILSLGPKGCYGAFMLVNETDHKGVWVSMFESDGSNDDLQRVINDKADNMDLVIEATLNTGNIVRCNGDKYGEKTLADLADDGVPQGRNYRLVPHDSLYLAPYSYSFEAKEEKYLGIISFFDYFIGMTDASITATNLDSTADETGPSKLADIFLPVGIDATSKLPIGRHIMTFKSDEAYLEATTKPSNYRFTAYITELQDFMLDAYVLKFSSGKDTKVTKKHFRDYQDQLYCVITSYTCSLIPREEPVVKPASDSTRVKDTKLKGKTEPKNAPWNNPQADPPKNSPAASKPTGSTSEPQNTNQSAPAQAPVKGRPQ
jgi:hypothetical protein